MMAFLYFVWICYTVCSLSVILGIIFLSILAKAEKKKNDERIREMLTKRPADEE